MEIAPKINIIKKNRVDCENTTNWEKINDNSQINANLSFFKKSDINLDGGLLIDEDNISKLYKINLSKIFSHDINFFNQCLYDKNRPIDFARVDNIIQSFNHQDHNFYNGFCTIGYLSGTNPQILDGQHRLSAANRLQQCHGYLRLVFFTDAKQMWDYYIMINQNLSVPNYYKSSENFLKNCIDEVCKNIHNKYDKTIFSSSRNCHRPHINLENLRETLFNIYNESDNEILKIHIDMSHQEQSISNITVDLYDFNESLKNKSPDYFYKFLGKAKTATQIYKKCTCKGDVYFGLLFTGSNDSLFQTKYLIFINNKYTPKTLELK